jgi:indolepyruvate ferredoxin oxidoreductase beta subunit
MGRGVVDKEAIIEVARSRARSYIGFDMLETARKFDSVINTALFGALAEAAVLPFGREAFEQTIREGGIAIESNLQTFAGSYELARQQRAGVQYAQPAAAAPEFQLPTATTAAGQALLSRVAGFPAATQEMIYLGVKKLVDYQDTRYAELYLERLQSLAKLERGDEAVLTLEAARYLALWMAFEDLPRVAQIKISPERFARFRQEVRAEEDQQVGVVEFLHPRVEEFCGVMPAGLGRFALKSRPLRGLLGLLAKPRQLRTNSVHGFLAFYLLAKMRRLRRSSLVYQIEQAHIEQWLDAIQRAAATDYDLAVELARCGRLIKGYGKTRERGTGNMQRILGLWSQHSELPARSLASLREAALAGESGEAMDAAERDLLASMSR